MDARLYALWDNQSEIEQVSGTTFTVKRGDNEPDLGIELILNGSTFDLSGFTPVLYLKFDMTLTTALSSSPNSTVLRVSPDDRLKVGDTIIVNNEKMEVEEINDIPTSTAVSVVVERGIDGTSTEEHATNSIVRVVTLSEILTVVGAGKFAGIGDIGLFNLDSVDTSILGDFGMEIVFSRTGVGAASFTIPTSGEFTLSVVRDFESI